MASGTSTDAPFARLGGEPKLREIISDFVDRVMDDVMIGFFFRGVNRAHLKDMEYQMAARMLGAKTPYQGRPMGEAHRKHRIMGGQFARRKQILRETLHDHGVEESIRDIWLQHTDALRAQITTGQDGECD